VDRPIAVLTGPTGAGKTDVALALAREFPLEIVSVDSALVYRGLDIGSAKPSREVREQVPHHLIDLRSSRTPAIRQVSSCAMPRAIGTSRRAAGSAARRRDDATCARLPVESRSCPG
jgi:cytidylate kinase